MPFNLFSPLFLPSKSTPNFVLRQASVSSLLSWTFDWSVLIDKFFLSILISKPFYIPRVVSNPHILDLLHRSLCLQTFNTVTFFILPTHKASVVLFSIFSLTANFTFFGHAFLPPIFSFSQRNCFFYRYTNTLPLCL